MGDKGILTAILAIGIVVVVLLIAPGASRIAMNYRPDLTASTSRFTPGTYYGDRSGEYYYTIHRYVPQQQYVYPSTTTYTYTSSGTGYEGEMMFSDGCTMTSPYSLTTGEPCS